VTIDDIRTLYEYHYWAHERMMTAVQRLTPEELDRDLGASHVSVRGTLVHMMSAEWLYLSRWHGVFPDNMLDAKAFPTLDALEDRWSGIRRELRGFLGRVQKGHLNNLMIYRDTGGEEVKLPLYVNLMHLVNHATYHRGQVANLIRQLGHEPEPTDLFRFYIEEQVLIESENVVELEEFGGGYSRPADDEF
jgi:uncharacterized damage-inducible protein DinB